MPSIDRLLELLICEGGSDLHLAEGQPPKLRKHGDIMPIGDEAVTQAEVVMMLREICETKQWDIFE
jgi:twitching motility protein PilT